MNKYSKSDLANILHIAVPTKKDQTKRKSLIEYWNKREIISPIEKNISAGQRSHYSENECLIAVIAYKLFLIGFSSDSIFEITSRIPSRDRQGNLYSALREKTLPYRSQYYLSLQEVFHPEPDYIVFMPIFLEENETTIPGSSLQINISLTDLFSPLYEFMLND
ncbi:MAG: hypothetical protein JKY84_01805 [Emcibacteraceae bacterium]|nr:hypothetical protein [Emcibacteraceae bacterium]